MKEAKTPMKILLDTLFITPFQKARTPITLLLNRSCEAKGPPTIILNQNSEGLYASSGDRRKLRVNGNGLCGDQLCVSGVALLGALDRHGPHPFHRAGLVIVDHLLSDL